MENEFGYIEIENTTNNFQKHAGIHAQFDIYSPCRLIFVIKFEAHRGHREYWHEILSSKIITPHADIFHTLHNQFNVGDGVHSRTKTERLLIMYSFVDMICSAAREQQYENELPKINENKATALFQLEYISMVVNEKRDALVRTQLLRVNNIMRKKLCKQTK
jgi:hypothetical protein